MFLKKIKSTTDPRLRSLLQKAVRRGADDVVKETIRNLIALGDQTWLRSRAAVITFEESWPLAQYLVLTREHQTKEDALLRVSHATKQKDAAGLGALAFALHEGDHSMMDFVPSKLAINIVSEAINRPTAFFSWATSQCTSSESQSVVTAARDYIAAATWGWDKATILAGGFLAASNGVPILPKSNVNSNNFPYWVALDKHTPEGKEVFRKVSAQYKISYRQLIWASFYCESAYVNALEPSPWFEAERDWRLRKTGLNFQTAMDLWNFIRPSISSELSSAAQELCLKVERRNPIQGNLL
jgi:hypothetical protein